MLQMALFLLFVLLVAFGFSWLSDQPGEITINFAGYERAFTPVEFIISIILVFSVVFAVWHFVQRVIGVPAFIAQMFKRRREKRGLEALSAGLIAVGIGDRQGANRFAGQARRSLPNEPLTALLRAQSAQLIGDRPTARRIYEAMLEAQDTEILGLRGLFLEAEHEQEDVAAFQYAERAMALNPKLQWSVQAVFDAQCKQGDWAGALKTLDVARQHKHMERTLAARRKAVLLTAQARDLEEEDMDKALELALEAHGIAKDLVPAADIAGRILASKGNTSKAAKVLSRTWKQSPHPDLAVTYAYARPGDSPRDRLQRVQTLSAMTPSNLEGPMAVALAAIEAKELDIAVRALERLAEKDPSARVCTLMARIEAEKGDQGRMREWLARAVKAPRDSAWSASGYVSDKWMPVSPVTGELDCFEWKVPTETIGAIVPRDREDLLPMDMVGREDQPRVTPEEPDEADEEVIDARAEVHEEAEARGTSVMVAEKTEVAPSVEEDSKGTDVIQRPESIVTPEKQEEQVEARKDNVIIQEEEPVATALRPKVEKKAPSEPKIYVPPRAPDDPGIGPMDD